MADTGDFCKRSRSAGQGNRPDECRLIRRKPHWGNAELNQRSIRWPCVETIHRRPTPALRAWSRHSPDHNAPTGAAMATWCGRKIPCPTRACGFESRHQHASSSREKSRLFSFSQEFQGFPVFHFLSFISYFFCCLIVFLKNVTRNVTRNQKPH